RLRRSNAAFCFSAPKQDCFRLRSSSYGGQVAYARNDDLEASALGCLKFKSEICTERLYLLSLRRSLSASIVSRFWNCDKSDRGWRERHSIGRHRRAFEYRQLIACGKLKQAAVEPDTLVQAVRAIERVTHRRRRNYQCMRCIAVGIDHQKRHAAWPAALTMGVDVKAGLAG